MSMRENVLNGCKNRYEEINQFRIGDITQHLISIDIEEVERTGGRVVDIHERLICDNLEYNSFGRFLKK